METELIVQEKNNNTFQEIQEKFINSNIGKVINNGIDIALKSVLPDLIEDEVIEIKDSILENGLKEGIVTALSSVKNFTKSTLGIVTGEFENTTQVEMAVKKGGIIDTLSNVLDYAVDKAEDNGKINETISNLIKNGKDSILNIVSEKIESALETQVKNVEKLQNYCEEWKENYKAQDFSKMEKSYNNIEKYLEKTLPLKNTLDTAKEIENLHNLIKNNNQNFEISDNEKLLAEKLVI